MRYMILFGYYSAVDPKGRDPSKCNTSEVWNFRSFTSFEDSFSRKVKESYSAQDDNSNTPFIMTSRIRKQAIRGY
ncbi:MAG: hypothetical protein K8T10_18000 [Candidatus Eremiobacteraeota bacterium]|nr:hypothetical protein [Candidatus Eremiobacteraeota bacterium]